MLPWLNPLLQEGACKCFTKVLDMESACMESANHSLSMTRKAGLNCFPSNGESASAGAARSRRCTRHRKSCTLEDRLRTD